MSFMFFQDALRETNEVETTKHTNAMGWEQSHSLLFRRIVGFNQTTKRIL